MSELKCTGTIKQIGELIKFDSGFQKVEFILTTNEKYPQDVKFDIVKEKAEQFLQYNKVGDAVEVDFNIRGSEYKDKYYVNLTAWKVFKADVEQFTGLKQDSPVELEDATKTHISESDTLPF